MVMRWFLVALALLFAPAAARAQDAGGPSSADPYALQANGVYICKSITGYTSNCNEQYCDTNAKTLRNNGPIDTTVRNLVLIIIGQSNRQAEAPTAYVPPHASQIDNFSICDGAVYAYSDPPLGSSYIATGIPGGGPGHVGGRVAELLIAGGQFDRVIVAPIGIGGASVSQFATGGPMANRLCVTVARLKERGIVPGTNVTFAIEYGQGETDVFMAPATYTAYLNNVISNVYACGFVGRFFVAKETWINSTVYPLIQAAQMAVINHAAGIWESADADTIGNPYRVIDYPPSGTTHFNDSGLATLAPAIVGAMHASGPPF